MNKLLTHLKSIWSTWCSLSLVLRICMGLILGALLGLLCPQQLWVGIFGRLFVGALKAIAPVLVFVLVVSALATDMAERRSTPPAE